jgi:hypothetical protein
MRKMAAAVGLALAMSSSPSAAPLEGEGAPVGRIFHYLRTNIDGSAPEHIHVFRRDATRIEVYKMVTRCTNAALVTANLDLTLGYAPRVTGGSLQPNAKHKEFAFITYDAAKRIVSMRLDLRDMVIVGGPAEITEQTAADAPFHTYDFDLSDLTVLAPGLTKDHKDIAFDLLILWPPATDKRLRFLGKAQLVFKGVEERAGHKALRYEATGAAFGDKGGPIWFDAHEGHIVDVEWRMPNHAGYQNFKLALQGIDDGGAEAWKRLLTTHYEDCR